MLVLIKSSIEDAAELQRITAAAMKMLGKMVTVAHHDSGPNVIEIRDGEEKDLEALRGYNLVLERIVIH